MYELVIYWPSAVDKDVIISEMISFIPKGIKIEYKENEDIRVSRKYQLVSWYNDVRECLRVQSYVITKLIVEKKLYYIETEINILENKNV